MSTTILDGENVNNPRSSLKKLRASGMSIDSERYDPKNEVRILVLYSGGTIGMRSHSGVYIPEPNFLRPELKKLPMFHDPDYAIQFEGDEEDVPLVMPQSKEGKRVIYSVYEYDPLLDSANMSIGDYIRIAQDIKKNYQLFNGFVVLHGTDTMAYTASALSFMLEYLGKPVILTGSQIPIFETRSDGRDNFLGALIVAGNYVLPEVCVYFHNKLLRGNRSTKVDSGAMDAFQSPNMHPLAELEINIKVHWKAVYRPTKNCAFTIQDRMCTNVGLLRFFPSITAQTVKAFLQPPMQGVVLQSYGAGNGPDTRADILEILLEATSRDVLIVNITQCSRGKVSAAYASGKALFDAGVIPGADMTPEAALMKLSYVLSKKEWNVKRKREQMQKNLRGELTSTESDVEQVQLSIIDKLSKTLKISTDQEVELLKESLFPSLACAAARRGDKDRLRLLAEAGADLKLGDHDDRTPLHVACASGHVDTVEYLIEQGAFIHLKDRYGHMAIDDAVRFAHLKVIDVLVRNGGKLMLSSSKVQAYLCYAVINEKIENLEAWHRAGADMNLTDHYGKTPLHLACNLGKVQQAKDLIQFGAKLDAKDAYGISPLDEAKVNQHGSIVELLGQYLNNT